MLTWILFILAAVLEVAGDALIRKVLRGGGVLLIVLGFVVLGSYGIAVNTIKWDFGRLLGVYVAFFALVSILFGKYVFAETISMSTWLGLALIVAGGLVIQFGHSVKP
jgi:small multidrug resistance family-3 protein